MSVCVFSSVRLPESQCSYFMLMHTTYMSEDNKWQLIQIPLSANGHSWRIDIEKKVLWISRESHVDLSRGLMLKSFAKSFAEQNKFRRIRWTLLRGLMLEPWRPLKWTISKMDINGPLDRQISTIQCIYEQDLDSHVSRWASRCSGRYA